MRAPFLYCLGLFLSSFFTYAGEPAPVRVLVWDERQPAQKKGYNGGWLGDAVAEYLAKQPGITVKSVSLDSPEQGLDAATLDATDAIVWWGHVRQKDVKVANVIEVVKRVREGKLGFVPLHSAHWSVPFVQLMQERAKADALAKIPEAERATAKWEYLNTSPIGIVRKPEERLTPFVEKEGDVWKLTLPQCVFPSVRADGAPSHVTTLLPKHPIAAGIPEKWDIPQTEMYGEPFHVPEPDVVVFEEKWDKGERFRSGCGWTVDKGRVFYFRPGHETYPVYRDENCLRVVLNAVRWVAPSGGK